ncbi:hypothetical protein ASPSYDRAFT_84029 [Aspergillus sydowii CBS 593.65]|uniref:F-box domain-containing protein n=1 Tax=Aspergillus sydowii CBS 593.65 TaxID=1036612 RepID=A0A1L9TX42_9EURO|nr:uncharacterized protein ASPSYDRAFT_84029 [Aspergillus sydowii CBS 593.65]OJJ63996.1 hypothetical protein ASPSYDRAFT_84029 [Aspergillus sydowii CBS 593.65]
MLDQLPAEILLEVFRYVDKNTLINLYQLCRRFYSIIDPQLREIHRTKKFSLNTDLTLSGSVEKRTLKFIEDLVFVSTCEDDQGLDCFQESDLSSGLDENGDDGIMGTRTVHSTADTGVQLVVGEGIFIITVPGMGEGLLDGTRA